MEVKALQLQEGTRKVKCVRTMWAKGDLRHVIAVALAEVEATENMESVDAITGAATTG